METLRIFSFVNRQMSDKLSIIVNADTMQVRVETRGFLVPLLFILVTSGLNRTINQCRMREASTRSLIFNTLMTHYFSVRVTSGK